MPVVSITESTESEIAASVSLTELVRSDTGLTPAGVVLPLAFTDQGGGTAWGVSFTDPAALPPRYDFIFRITWPEGGFSDVSSSLTTGKAVGFWTSQSQVEQQYGVDNTGLDADLNDNGSGVAAIWQAALNWTDALIDRIFGQAGYSRPTDLTLTDYKLASGYAAAIVRNEIHKARGWTETNAAGGPSTGGVYQKDADAAIEALEEMAEEGVSFPEIVDASGQVQGTAPQILRPTMDAEGRPLAIAGDFDRPYYDPNLGGYRW